MPTLLQALEEKYGFAETSDIEAEPELLMLRLPKRPPRQRFDFQLSFIATFADDGRSPIWLDHG
jgi:hypothetical protein